MDGHELNEKKCERCGKLFVPEKAHFRNCPRCFQDTASIGFTKVNRQRKGADHRHGGVSRLHDDRRTVTLRGNETRENILAGIKVFLTEMYGKPTGVSTLLLWNGLSEAEIDQLSDDRLLNSFVMDLCPELDKWFRNSYGRKFAGVLIEYYGLYGDKRASLNALVNNWDFTDLAHAQKYIGWALRELRLSQSTFEQILLQSAQTILKRHQ